jgi:MFS family permease
VQDIPGLKRVVRQSFTLTEKDKKTIRSLFFYFFFLLFIFSDAFFTMQAKEVGIATAVIPLLFAVSAGVQTLTSYGFGIFIDSFGARRILLFAYVCGAAAQGLLYLQDPHLTWIAYAFLGLFTVASLNANRAFISQNADNRGSVYGVFYAGVALFGATGAYVSGMIWEHFGISSALLFSLTGTLFLSLLFIGSILYRYGFKKIGKLL